MDAAVDDLQDLDVEGLIQRALASRVWAVVGASRDPSRWGHRVLAELIRGGYTVYPVNPKADEVLGLRAYASVTDLPETPDVVELVTPPHVTEEVLRDCAARGVRLVWMQPGAGSEAADRFCQENGIRAIDGACLLHERRYRRQPSADR
jgi:uncharacterized protein